MPVERKISSWAAIDWRNEMSREELLTVRIWQLERRLEDVERARAKLRTTRERTKGRLEQTHRLWPKKIEEGDWVLVYNSNLDNQHKATRKFARRWFGPYTVTSANDNSTYHLAELDGMQIAVPIAGKRIKAFRKRHEDEPYSGSAHLHQVETKFPYYFSSFSSGDTHSCLLGSFHLSFRDLLLYYVLFLFFEISLQSMQILGWSLILYVLLLYHLLIL